MSGITNEIKVGDMVVITNDMCSQKGHMGIVEEVDVSNIPYKVMFEDYYLPVWYKRKHIELVQPVEDKPALTTQDGTCSTVGYVDGGITTYDITFGTTICPIDTFTWNCDVTNPLVCTNGEIMCGGDGLAFNSQSHMNSITRVNNEKFMSIKNKIKMLMTGEPEKTLIKHGILTIDKEFTNEGKQLFNDFVEKKFKDEFLAEVYGVLKDEKVDDKLED